MAMSRRALLRLRWTRIVNLAVISHWVIGINQGLCTSLYQIILVMASELTIICLDFIRNRSQNPHYFPVNHVVIDVQNRGVGAELKVVRQNFMASSWQVLWTELDISAISKSSSVLKASHAWESGGMPLPEF